MGDQNTILTQEDLRQLLKRATFGPSARSLKRARKRVGGTRGEAADYVLDLKRKAPKLPKKSDTTLRDLHDKWAKHLIKSKTPFQDRMALFWHDHFSITGSAINSEEDTGNHILKHYEFGLGDFRHYVKQENRDSAMMTFLDTRLNSKSEPNENYARELCELFTLGAFDLNGVENYAQQDIAQIARAFSGWRPSDDGAYLDAGQHDTEAEFPERGSKVLFKNTYGFDAAGASFTTGGEGANEIDEVIDILFAHLDSDGENTVARRTAFRLLEYFCYASPDKSIVDEVVLDSNFAIDWNLEALMRSIMVHDVFFETMAAAPFDASTKKSIKWPIDLVISTLQMTRGKPQGRSLVLPGLQSKDLFSYLRDMGQELGDPPSVFGWDWENSWISTGTLLARHQFIADLTSTGTGSRYVRVDRLVSTRLTDPVEILDAVLDSLNMKSQFDETERGYLLDYLTNDGALTSLDLKDYLTVRLRLTGLYGLVMNAPNFQLQ
jgi:uncharacterized protein (DUF1800 family)